MVHKKRLSTILIVMILILALFAVPAMAEEAGETPDASGGDTVADEVTSTLPDGNAGDGETEQGDSETADEPIDENTTAIARVYEWAKEYYGEIIVAVLSAALGACGLLFKGKFSTLIRAIVGLVKSQSGVEAATNTNTEAMNRLEANQAQLNEYYEKYAKNEEERNKVTAALLVEVMALLEIQHISCINNSNVPQSMKNLVTSKYARCLSVINDDAEIKAAYDEMRTTLGLSGERSHEKTNT